MSDLLNSRHNVASCPLGLSEGKLRHMVKYWFTVHWPHPKLAEFEEGWHIFLRAKYKNLAEQVLPGHQVLFYETLEGGAGTHDGRGGIVCAAEVVEMNDEQRKSPSGDSSFPIKIPCGNHRICKIVNGKPEIVMPALVIGNIDSALRIVARKNFAACIDQPETGRFAFQGGLLEISREQFDKLFGMLTK
jgi:hypothetical protein